MKIKFPVFEKDLPSAFEMIIVMILGGTILIFVALLTFIIGYHIGVIPVIALYFLASLTVAFCTGMIKIELPETKKDDA